MTISEQLAEKGEKLRLKDIPDETVENQKKYILDLLGCVLGAKKVDSSLAMVDTIKELGGSNDSTVFGHGMKTSMTNAALANATMGHAFDMDDDHRKGTLHSSVVILPALLSVGEKYELDGESLLTSFIYGSEISIRLGESFKGQTYYQGFHPTGTCGVFGAAAGVAKLLDLDKRQIMLSMGIAGSQAAGLLEWKAQGTWTKRLQAGHPAMCGVLSALLAKRNYIAPSTIFEGEDGFVRAYSYKDIYDLELITKDFGDKWEVDDNSIKVHACCRFSAPLADCGLDLYNRGVKPEEVDEILAKVNKYTIKVLCTPSERKYKPQTEVDAQFSLPYAIAVTMCKGRASVLEFTEEAIKDKDVLELASKVKWELDPETEKVYPEYYPSTVIVRTKNGKEYVSYVDYPKGDPENPVSFEEVEEKFRFLASFTISEEKIEKVIEIVSSLEKLENVKELVSYLY